MKFCKYSIPQKSLDNFLLKERFQNLNGQRICKIIIYPCRRAIDIEKCGNCAWPLRIKKENYGLVKENGKYIIKD